MNLLYKQIGLDIDNKSHPFQSYIKNFFINIDFDFVKKTEICLDPQEIMDDSSNFYGITYYYFNDSDVSSQKKAQFSHFSLN